jgi:hypothetical protein
VKKEKYKKHASPHFVLAVMLSERSPLIVRSFSLSFIIYRLVT